MNFLIILGVFVSTYNSVGASTIYGLSGAEIEGIRNCYGLSCPEGTVACNKLTKSTDDLQYVDTIIKCEDNTGKSLNTDNQRSANPFPGTRYSSFSYQGNYRIRLGALENSRSGIAQPIYNSNRNPTYYNKDNDVEVF